MPSQISSCDSIVLATGNAKKVREMRPLLEPLQIELVSLGSIKEALDVEENGTTFIENARLKATVQARHLNRWCIGEDSGLCVDALDGAPGIYSARFSAPNPTDEKNNQKLLRELEGLPANRRGAHYVSTIVLSNPDGESVIEASGKCHGRIIEAYRGSGGFGYDPLFEIREYHRTFAELGPSVKNALSHRGRALASFIGQLQRLLSSAELAR